MGAIWRDACSVPGLATSSTAVVSRARGAAEIPTERRVTLSRGVARGLQITHPTTDRSTTNSYPMKNSFRSYLSAAAAAVALLVWAAPVTTQADDAKASPTGTWTWTMPGRNGGPDRKSTLKLKAEGDKLTGKVSSPGRDGQAMETEISDGKVKGDEIEFKVVREFNGNKFVIGYMGKVSGDTIKGKTEFERQGQKTSRDWEAKREVEKK